MRYFTKSLVVAVLTATLAACAAPPTPTVLPPAATSLPPADTSVPSTAVPPTEVPPTPVPPTSTVAPTSGPTPTAAPTRLTLATGATDTDVNGQLQAGEVRTFVLTASKDQPMIVNLSSPNNAVRLAIRGQDGTQLLTADAAQTTWQGLLPASQDYVLQAIAPSNASSFDLSVEIASRITFASGATKAVVNGTALAGPITTYVLRALAGQTLTASLTSTNNAVALEIYGFQDGQPLVRSAAGATTWTGQLQATQDYIIKAVQTGTPVDFILVLTAPPASSGSTPTRLTLAAGATDTDVNGQLQAAEVKTFVLRAAKGQPMIVSLSSPNNAVRLAIRGQDGTQLLTADAAKTTWQGLLPATQDYVLQVIAPANATSFDLSVEIASRITFASGTTSVAVNGTAQAGPITTYVLRALAGQTMTATLKSATNSAVLTIYGFQDGIPLVRSAADATTFTGKLPGTQDYIVKAVQTGAPVDFTLTVTVK
jgi:hypothetical protein